MDAPAVSSSFTTSELPDLAALRNAVIPFCMVEQLMHLFRISVANSFLLLCMVVLYGSYVGIITRIMYWLMYNLWCFTILML